ncbi:MAG: FG-GAP repeat protein [Planctomycetes bacterium]|nr:FG-GAP repeat protein [Planctomycetota bacterium]MBI3833806.1 FG-GAP repeat protein [Planctomycetota bacterium]
MGKASIGATVFAFTIAAVLSVGSNSSFAQTTCTATPGIRLGPSDGGSKDQLGTSVAVNGSSAFLGAPGRVVSGTFNHVGTVYVARQNGTLWSIAQQLTPSDGVDGDQFGTSIAIDGAWAVVGAPGTNIYSGGSAYVYHYNGSSWVYSQTLIPADNTTSDIVGTSVSISGTNMVIGAYGRQTYAGGAYVYKLSGSTWISAQTLVAPDAAAYDFFGYSTGISGNVIIVGAYGDDVFGSNSGSAYVYRNNGTSWSYSQKLTPSGGLAGDNFGWTVSIDGPDAVIGAPDRDELGASSGAAYVFHDNGTSWSQVTKFLASDGGAYDWFGRSVSISGTGILIGAQKWSNDLTGITGIGKAYYFDYDGTSWAEALGLYQPSPWGWYDDHFGSAVALDGGSAVVGAIDEDPPAMDTGKAYIYDVTCATTLTLGCQTITDCDPVNPCAWTCVASTCQRVVAPNGTLCSDGNLCNGNETCQNGVCTAGTPLNCADTNPCTTDSCVAATGCTHTNLADGTACGSTVSADCDSPDSCLSGVCVSNYKANGTACTDDGNACTNDVCNGSGSCTHPAKTNGTSCSDGNACTTGDTCSNGVCVGGPALNCNDNNPCTTDSCAPSTGCAHVSAANGTACGSSASTDCDSADTCSNGTCVPNYKASGTVCTDDGNACTSDVCNGAGTCTHPIKANGTACGSSAGTDCDSPDSCANGVCSSNHIVSGTVCTDDGNACTSDVCDGAGTCTHPIKANGTACGSSAGTDCDNPDSCSNGTCVPNYKASGTACTDDGNPNTTDTCNGSGTCQHTTSSCPDDGNPCTNEVISGGVCTHPNKADGTACGNATSTDCDSPDTCSNGVCSSNYKASGTFCTDDGNACTSDVCNGAGVCTHPSKTNGTACGSSSNTDCDNPDTCNNGVCAPNYELSGTACTDDGNACTSDVCNGAGTCTHTAKANGTSCSDGNVCNGAETCQNGACAAGTALNCNDNNPCTTDSCVATSGCVYTNAPNGTACGSQISTDCDNADTCSNGTCVPNYDPSGTACTDDGNPCTGDVCNGSGACTHPSKADGSACGSSVNTDCDKPDSCLAGVCNSNYIARDGLCTDDGNACTRDTCDGLGKCQHTAIVCSDGNACTTDGCDPATGCKFTWPACGLADSCCGPLCLPGNDSDCCGAAGATCTSNGQCCSNSCKRSGGRKVCR